MTGMHVVADVFCINCHAQVGWTYLDTVEDSQKYKVGKFILEKAKIRKSANWRAQPQPPVAPSPPPPPQ